MACFWSFPGRLGWCLRQPWFRFRLESLGFLQGLFWRTLGCLLALEKSGDVLEMINLWPPREGQVSDQTFRAKFSTFNIQWHRDSWSIFEPRPSFFFAPLLVLIQGFVTVPFREYWTSPYSSHYRPYTIHGWVMWPMGTSVMTHVIPWCRGAVSVLSTMPFESIAARGTLSDGDDRSKMWRHPMAPWHHGAMGLKPSTLRVKPW